MLFIQVSKPTVPGNITNINMACMTFTGKDPSGRDTWSMQKQLQNPNLSLANVCQERIDEDTKFCIEIQPGHYEVLENNSTLSDAIAVHKKHHDSNQFRQLWCINHTFKGNKHISVDRIWLCFSSGVCKFLVLVHSNATYQHLLELCDSLPDLKGHEIIHCDSDKHCIRDGQELRSLTALKINNQMDANHYLACIVTNGEQYMLDDSAQTFKRPIHVLTNDFGAYIRRHAKITHPPHKPSDAASSSQFPICIYPVTGFFHNVDIFDEDTVEDAIKKFYTATGKLFKYCVSPESVVTDRVNGKQLKYAMTATAITDKQMKMPAFQFLSQLKEGEIIVASSYSEIRVSHKGQTKTAKIPEFNASCCTLGHLISTQEVQILPEELLFYKEEKDGEFNVYMHHQLVQDLCIPGEGIQLNLTSAEQMHGVGLGNNKLIPILFEVHIPRYQKWVIWDIKASTSMDTLHQKWKSRVDKGKNVSLILVSSDNKTSTECSQKQTTSVKDLMCEMTPRMHIRVTIVTHS